MNLLPFNKRSYQRLIEQGYKYLLVKKRRVPKHFDDDYTDVQILKAIRDRNENTSDDRCEPIASENITAILDQREVVSFVIISEG